MKVGDKIIAIKNKEKYNLGEIFIIVYISKRHIRVLNNLGHWLVEDFILYKGDKFNKDIKDFLS